tara:strand:+ start:1128 stop:1328 length:201 start_codon:yes stop_codon:yes gene_type:complete
MRFSPKKGWLYIAVNKEVALILYSLVIDRLEHKRMNSKVRSDLIVIQSILYSVLAEPVPLTPREEQ